MKETTPHQKNCAMYSPLMNDVTLLLSLQKFIFGVFTFQKLTLSILIDPLLWNISLSTDYIRNLAGDPIRKSFLQGVWIWLNGTCNALLLGLYHQLCSSLRPLPRSKLHPAFVKCHLNCNLSFVMKSSCKQPVLLGTQCNHFCYYHQLVFFTVFKFHKATILSQLQI